MGNSCSGAREVTSTAELHRDHTGIIRMKSVARSYFWWPHSDKAIEDLVKSCRSCQEAPAAAPLHPWV